MPGANPCRARLRRANAARATIRIVAQARVGYRYPDGGLDHRDCVPPASTPRRPFHHAVTCPSTEGCAAGSREHDRSAQFRGYQNEKRETGAHRRLQGHGDEGVILMTDSGQIYSTNPSGTAFIRQITVGRTVAEAVSAVLDEYDVQEDVLLADLEELIAFLEAEGVVVTVGS